MQARYGWRKAVLLFSAAGLLAVLLAYGNSWDNAFHFDDFHTIVDNPAVRSLSNVPKFFEDATLFSVQPGNRTYRPIVSASLALDYALGHGYEPFWFHLSTMLWFLVLLVSTGFLYFAVMERMRPQATESNALWAIAGATWFGLHPAIAETVNYVIQRGDLYCTLGCVGALVLWVQRPRERPYGLYLVPLVLALLSKPPAAVFPLLLAAWVWFFEAHGSLPERWKTAGRAALPSLGVVAVLMVFQSHMTPKTFAPSIISAADYRLTQPLVWLRYFGELFLPLHLNVDTDLPAYSTVTTAVAAGFIFLASLALGITWTARRREWYPVAFGLLWFVITQLPTSLYTLSEVENDHRMFFSFVGLIVAVLWTLRIVADRQVRSANSPALRNALIGCGLLALTGYAWGTHVRNRVWFSEDTLWKDDAEKSPHNGRGLMIYGLTLMNHGDYPGARAEFEKALLYTPAYPTLEINLGIVNDLLGDSTEAERHFLRALQLAPTDDTTHAYYGRWLLRQGQLDGAISEERKAVTLNPARPMQQELLAQALAQKAAPGSAAGAAQAITAADWINRSLALFQSSQFDASIAAAREALKLDPKSPEAWNNIAAGYQSEKQWDKAIAAAKKAIEFKPDFQLAKNNLAWSMQQKSLAANAR